MNNITTKEFIESINFKYFETYSFQRKGQFDIYEELLKKYTNDNDSLTNEETIELKKLRKTIYNQENNFIFSENKKINKTAELVYTYDNTKNLNDELINILKTPFVDFDAWMCAPIYRDAILFYDTNNMIIDGINICFECSNIINLNKIEILTDRIVYEKLKEFLQSIGHKIK